MLSTAPVVTSAEVNASDNTHRLIEVVLGEQPGEVLGYVEAAEFLDTTLNVVRWYTTSKNAEHRKLPSKFFPVKGWKRPIRYFLRSELEEWKRTANNKDYGWPPSELQLLNNKSDKMLTPKAKHFPDNGEEIPGYQGLSGRWIQPVWRNCQSCGKRFISADRRNLHSHDSCYHLAHE